jgi:hypothetical protein
MPAQLLFDFSENDLVRHAKSAAGYIKSLPPPPEKTEPAGGDTLAPASWKPTFDEKNNIYDYTSYPANKLLLADPNTVFVKPPPPWLPPIDHEAAVRQKFIPLFQFDGPDAFLVSRFRITLEQFAAMVDYHIKYEKAREKETALKKEKELIESYKAKLSELKTLSASDGPGIREKIAMVEKKLADGFMIKVKRISILNINKILTAQLNLFKKNNLSIKEAWACYTEFRQKLRQKISDMLCQREDYESSYSKGQITSYGPSHTNDRLLNDYGVLVKRQNGGAISPREIEQIKSSLDRFYALMGNFSSAARDYRLKISHAGEKNMFASRFVGIFALFHRAIGVSFKEEETGPIILAHELAHFLDAQAGGGTQHFFASDNASTPEYAVAGAFRSLMNKTPSVIKSAYYNRTCECFARAVEQYTAFHTLKEYSDKISTIPAYVPREDFIKTIQPLIEEYKKVRQCLLNPPALPPDLNTRRKNTPLPGLPERKKPAGKQTASMER